MKQLTLNFQNDLEPTGETTILSSPVGSRKSHANHTALPENEKAKMMNATCGQKCLEQYEKFPRHTLWGKTFMGLLIGTGDWFSMRCKLTWKLKGTKYSRLYFQLVPSTPRTNGSAFGLLPTAQANCSKGMRPENVVIKGGKMYNRNTGKQIQSSPEQWAKMGLLPTQTTMDHMPPKTDKAILKEMTVTRPGRTQLSNLRDVVIRQPELLPTPRANKVNGCNLNSENLANRNKGNLEEQVAKWVTGMLPTPDAASGKTGYMGKNRDGKQQNLETVIRNSEPGLNSQLLNPQFVAEMMGFPVNWTELPFLSGETKVSKPMETQ